MCDLMVDEVSCGLNWFIIPLRDHNGHLLPGVTAGDIGAKAGRNGIDNGWIQFTQVRVPKDYMLSRWAQIDEEGSFEPSPKLALSYATLVTERIAFLAAFINTIGQVSTIATRYSCVRRQGSNDEKIMDYQSQYLRLMPAIASVFVVGVFHKNISERWSEMESGMHSDPEGFLEKLPDMHGVSAGAKAVISWWGCEFLEDCRRACGGHAYSAYNAIAGHIDDWGVMTTGGGDNVVIIQQTAVGFVINVRNTF